VYDSHGDPEHLFMGDGGWGMGDGGWGMHGILE